VALKGNLRTGAEIIGRKFSIGTSAFLSKKDHHIDQIIRTFLVILFFEQKSFGFVT
jgi:hypothetical protein